MALRRLAELEDQAYGRTVGESRLQDFLKDFPDSPHAEEARERLAKQVAARERDARAVRAMKQEVRRPPVEGRLSRPPVDERMSSLLRRAYVCACVVSIVLLAALAEFTHGRGSRASIFVPVTYAIACAVAGWIGRERLATSFVASTKQLGRWRQRLAGVGGAVAWQIITYVLVMLCGNLVSFARLVFLPTVRWTEAWLAVPIVMLVGLASFGLRQWLLTRLSRPRKTFSRAGAG